ncbi:MAG: hypothetical protein U9Q03_01525 [Patescibacteria group bacterium]|nr:hypothetical protein [Patescibacteria group bacterium]
MSTMSRDESRASTDANGSGRRYEEVCIVVSDLHLGEGMRVRVEYDGRRGIGRAWRALVRVARRRKDKIEDIENPLEGFLFDSEFSDFLDLMTERYGSTDAIRLKLLGDTFDPLTVTWQGRYEDPPYEHVGLDKMKRIIAGHPVFFGALARFAGRSNHRIDIFVGNHDLFLAWPSVRELLLKHVSGGDSGLLSRIRIIDHSQSFEEVDKQVLYVHGMDAEPHNEIDPKKAVVTDVLGVKLQKPILNAPYGSYMFVDLGIPLKLHNKYLGRLREDRDVWKHAARRQWLWGLYALIRLIWHFIYAHFFSFWDFRRKASTRKILDIVLATMTKHPVDKYALRLLKERECARVVVLGHSHKWKRDSGKDGTYLNTGTWTVSYRMFEREFELSWKRLQRFEPYWRTLQHFFRTGEVRFASRMIRFAASLTAIAILGTFVAGGFWPIDSFQLKVMGGIAIVFMGLVMTFRLFSVEPRLVDDTKLTFGLIRHFDDGTLKADLMEYLPDEKDFRECV